MKHYIFGAVLGLILPSSALPQQQILISPKFQLRDAQKSDLAAVTTIIVDAFAPSPVNRYIAPDYASHKAEYWQCVYEKLSEAADHADPGTTFVKVIAVEDKAVSVAIWNQLSQGDHKGQSGSLIESAISRCTNLPGTNVTRVEDFKKQMATIERDYFGLAYPHQLYLNLLATHPTWDGHGFAAMHLQWGKDKSLQLSDVAWPVTLLATPAGFPLYDSVGFESTANVSIRTLDDSDDLWFEVMQWQAKEHLVW